MFATFKLKTTGNDFCVRPASVTAVYRKEDTTYIHFDGHLVGVEEPVYEVLEKVDSSRPRRPGPRPKG